MKQTVRLLLAVLFWPLAWCRDRLSPGVRILMYHRVDQLPGYDQLTVTPQVFSRQMTWLARRRRVVSLSQALDELERGDVRRGTVVITFDDGYLDNLQHALPVLTEHGLPATVFVTTGFANGQGSHPRYPGSQGLHMDWQQLKQWQAAGPYELGAHSVTHPYLSRTSNEQCEREIADCLRDFDREQVSHNQCFCYPSGDVTAREAGLVEGSGYRAAVTVAPGVNHAGTNRFLLYRTEITDRDTGLGFILKLAGAFDLIHVLLHWQRRIRFSRAAAAARQN